MLYSFIAAMPLFHFLLFLLYNLISFYLPKDGEREIYFTPILVQHTNESFSWRWCCRYTDLCIVYKESDLMQKDHDVGKKVKSFFYKFMTLLSQDLFLYELQFFFLSIEKLYFPDKFFFTFSRWKNVLWANVQV